ncbi:MAG: molybdenum cofactor biosynthesis protein MoaE [Acidobacteriota bacterium]
MADIIRVTSEPIDVQALVEDLRRPSCGAIASFVGVVRDHNRGRRVRYLIYQSYAPMAEREMAAIARETHRRWSIEALALVHRTGRLAVGEVAVAVIVVAGHRREALAACSFGIERIKRDVPIWKKEFGASGSHWIHDDPEAGPPPEEGA